MNQKTKRMIAGGFTLVEAMVAISILSLAVTGPLLIAQKGIDSAIYSKDQITAFYLAEEAVEYVRNVRDTNRIQGNPWLNGLNNCLSNVGNGQCTIDSHYLNFTNASAVLACGSTCSPLQFDTVNGIYGYSSGWQTTKFTRSVTINTLGDPSGKEAAVSVVISWNTGLFSAARTFTVKEYIFNF